MPYDKITSLTNPKIKHVVALRSRKQRREDGLTVVEGVREIMRALEAGVAFRELYICGPQDEASALIKKVAAKKVPVHETTEKVFAKIAYGDRNEGVVAVCAPKAVTFADLPSKKAPLYVVVECVEKPGNLGGILRTCDGAGVDGMIICDGRTDLYNPNVVRASLGTVFSVKTVVSTNDAALAFLRSRNVTMCAAMPRAKTVYTKAALTGALAVVVGGEQDGLTDFWGNHSDLKVNIPMCGRADSLNVSVSAAILLYETIRQRTR